MKKAEIIIGIIGLIALVLNFFLVPGGTVLLVVSYMFLSTLYMFCSFLLFNGIRLRGVFKSESYKGVKDIRLMGAILTGLALAVTVVGILFKFMGWPGATVNLMFGIFGLIISSVIIGIKYLRTRSTFYTDIFKRIALYGGIGFVLYWLPKDAFLEAKYRNYPSYIDAVKKSNADPTNQELRERVNEEQERIYKYEEETL